MNKIWITDDFMCKISKYTPSVHKHKHTHIQGHTCIGIHPAYCIIVCLHTHSLTHARRETCTLAEWNEKFVDCHFDVLYTQTHTVFFILPGENDVWQRGFMKILLTLIPNAQHQIHQCLYVAVKGKERERETEISTSCAYYNNIAASSYPMKIHRYG